MENLVIAAASNIDHIELNGRKSHEFLNGAAVYLGFAASSQIGTRVITCVGDEPGNDKVIQDIEKYNAIKKPKFDIIKMKGGRSFKQTFAKKDGALEVIDKDYGNYNDWEPKISPFQTQTLLLGTGNPLFQKCVLDACTHADNILLDSKLIHFQVRASKVDALLKRVDTFFGTMDEIKQLLLNCNLPTTYKLFEKYPNLRVIIEKDAGNGGKVFLSNGIVYIYRPETPSIEVCSDGAGDIFAGIYSGLISSKGIKYSVQKAAQISAESVKHFGIEKIEKSLNTNSNIKINIYESRWKEDERRDPKQEDTDRSY